jgi:hypothetical protein
VYTVVALAFVEIDEVEWGSFVAAASLDWLDGVIWPMVVGTGRGGGAGLCGWMVVGTGTHLRVRGGQ